MNALPEFDSSPHSPAASFDIATAGRRSRATGKRLLDELEELAATTPEEFLTQLSSAMRYPFLSAPELFAATPVFDVVPIARAIEHQFVIVERSDGTTIGCFADPFDTAKLDWINGVLTDEHLFLVHQSDLSAFLSRCEDSFRAIDDISASDAAETPGGDVVESLSIARITENSSLVVKLVNSTLYDALKAHASDIHIESTANGLVIKYRIDGVLSVSNRTPGTDVAEQIISRIKVLADLDISERRTPQDGRFKVAVKDREIDFRVSVMPSIYGEDAVLRILDKQDLADHMHGVRLTSLGFDDETVAVMRNLANDPYGMVLVTGPTGSGKTTTLYAMISEINRVDDKIITIEDPVEYQLPGILQIPVNEKKGLTFARGLRSILRHDPDRIMVGEIRDPETAQIAVQSALTGHLVFTTIHANNVFDVIGRFSQMSVDPYSFVSALNGILAQRLIRLLCSHCAQPTTPDESHLRASRIPTDMARNGRFLRAQGCGRCRGTGYKGRTAIAETLLLDDELRQLIVDRKPISQLKEYAMQQGLRPLRKSAVTLVLEGLTTLEEIDRVTFVS